MLISIATHILTALLLGQAAMASLLVGGRLVEVISRHLAFWDDPSARQVNRLTDRSHRAGMMASPVLSTHAILPGAALFSMMVWAFLTGQTVRPVRAVEVADTPLSVVILSVAALLIIFSSLVLGPRRKLGVMLRYPVYRAANLLSLGLIAVFLFLTEISIAASLSITFLMTALGSIVMIIMHSVAVYGVLGFLWAPFALGAAALRITAIAMIGPLMVMLPAWLSGGPQNAPFALSYRRHQQITSGTGEMPRCVAADTIAGAARPV